MDYFRLKKDMKELWKATFHDSDEYINLVFDTYFNPDLCAWKYDEERLVAALLGIPYRFGSLFGNLKGLYLCGLATAPEFRGRGIMSDLLDEINARASKLGFDFTFLIPADNGLRKYYNDRGYADAFRNISLRYTPAHSFYKEFVAWTDAHERLLKIERLRAFEKLHDAVLAIPSIPNVKPELNEERFDKFLENKKNITTEIIPGSSEKVEIIPDIDFKGAESIENNIDISAENILKIKSNDTLNGYVENQLFIPSKNDTFNIEVNKEIFKVEDNINLNSSLNNSLNYDSTMDLSLFIGENSMYSFDSLEFKSNEDKDVVFSFKEIFSFVHEQECKGRNLDLLHDPIDFLLVLIENNLSGGKLIVVYNENRKIVSLAIVSARNQDNEIKVKRVFASDHMSHLHLLHTISLYYPSSSIVVVAYPEYSAPLGVADKFYGASMMENDNVPEIGYAERVFSQQSAAQTYGMIRILSFSHFLEFLANVRSDVKFSILVKDEKSGIIECYKADRGKFTTMSLSDLNDNNRVDNQLGDGLILTKEQLQVLLMRKSDTEDAVFLAFDLPALQLNMALLLD